MDSANKIKNFIVKQPNTFLAILGFVLGVLIAFEYSTQLPRIINPVVSSIALEQMETNLDNEQAALKEQQEVVDSEISQLQSNLKNKQTGVASLISNVDLLRDKAGFSSKTGEGIEIILNDSNKSDENANAIAHASDLRDLIDLLWTRGASAISIEAAGGVEERIILTSSIDCIVNTVLINTTKSSPPFKVKAIGNRDALLAAVNDRVALKLIYDRVDKTGLIFYATDKSQITVAKYSGNLNLENAKILQ